VETGGIRRVLAEQKTQADRLRHFWAAFRLNPQEGWGMHLPRVEGFGDGNVRRGGVQND